MRSMRNLVLRLGEVAIPVGLTASVREPDETRFRVLHAGKCRAPISTRVFCPVDERILGPDETMTAWEVAPGQFLELTDEELVQLRPVDSSIVPISGFVTANELDPLLVKKRYHLQPSKAWVGRRPYRALAEAMAGQDVVAIARFTAWNSEQLTAISSRGLVLELATLNFLDDVVQADEIADAIADVDVVDLDVKLMHDVVTRYTRALKPDDLASEQRPRVRAFLDAKLAGQPLLAAAEDSEPEQPAAAPADLTVALRRTLKDAPRKRRAAATR